jgi:hypothetical protein
MRAPLWLFFSFTQPARRLLNLKRSRANAKKDRLTTAVWSDSPGAAGERCFVLLPGFRTWRLAENTHHSERSWCCAKQRMCYGEVE